MNVFEDLVVELKQENLLEDTVIDPAADAVEDHGHLNETISPDQPVVNEEFVPFAKGHDTPTTSVQSQSLEFDLPDVDLVNVESAAEAVPAAAAHEDKPVKVKKNKEFFKKRASAEASSLQMVDHVLTGVEREYLKVLPKAFDDFNAKKALNAFLQSDDEENSQGHVDAEFALMQETEAWCSALAERDKNVPVSSLRQYCENSKPALSSQALLSIARFYRNLPYSEPVRAKFDFVITRLFSRPGDYEKRTALFNRDETLTHINTLYNDWSSVPLYTAEDDDSKIMLTALSFEDMAVEAENAVSFDHLIESDFFGRLRLFKESISELFFAPSVTAAAIESNIRIGNAYVSLIERERRKLDSKSLRDKYENIDHAGVSDTAGRTLELVDILRELENIPVEVAAEEDFEQETVILDVGSPKTEKKKAGKKNNLLARLAQNATSVNKWFVVFGAVLILASVGVWVWANFFTAPDPPSASVQAVEFNGAAFQEHIKVAKLSGETLYVQLQPTWELLPKEKRQDILQAIFKTGGEKGFTQVNLISKDGKYVGYASANRLDVTMP